MICILDLPPRAEPESERDDLTHAFIFARAQGEETQR